MTKPKRTHPLGLLQHMAKSIKDYWFLFILLFVNRDTSSIWFWGLIIILIYIFLISPILDWLTLSYALEPDAVVIHSGIFVRHHEHIPYTRIQTVQSKQWFYLKPFNLEEVLIETASHKEHAPEARLTAVPTSLAGEIEQRRRQMAAQPTTAAETDTATDSATVAPTPTAAPVAAHYQISNGDLVKFGLTSLIFIPFLLVLLGLYNKVPKKFADDLVADAARATHVILIAGIIAVILIAWLGAFLWTLIRYYHFELTRQSGNLTTVKGLLQRNTITAPLNRIQAVRIKQNILRQWLHLQTVQLLIASSAANKDDDNDLVVMPVIPTAATHSTMHPFITWLPKQQPALTQLRAPHSWYQIRNAMLLVAIPIAVLWWLIPSWGWLSLILLPIAALEGRYAANNTAGELLTPQLLAVQTGHFWTRDLFYVPAEKIQSMTIRRSFWMQRTQLAHLTINVRHGNRNQAIRLRYLPTENAHAIYSWYRHQA